MATQCRAHAGNHLPQTAVRLTSHSPLVASTVKRENIFITDTADDGTATIKQLEEHVFGKSMEQLLLSAYTVTAATGKSSEAAYLQCLGATTIIDRAETSGPGRPLAKEKWAGVIDSVGSHTLANACASTMSEGLVAACGLAQGMDFPATVAPFILRGVSLLGINSVTQPFERRVGAWERLSTQLNLDALSLMSKDINLEGAIGAAADLMDGRIRGRLNVDVNG